MLEWVVISVAGIVALFVAARLIGLWMDRWLIARRDPCPVCTSKALAFVGHQLADRRPLYRCDECHLYFELHGRRFIELGPDIVVTPRP